ncbi:hypothetical protein D3C72_1599750 [compost metagenome]
MYFFAIEITRRRLASIISFLALREARSPSFMRLLMSLSSSSGTTTRACRSIRFCCSSCTGGMLRPMMALQLLPAWASFSIHCRFSRLAGKSWMNFSCGRPHFSTMILRRARSFWRTLSTCSRSMSHSFSMVLAVKRMVINSADSWFCTFLYWAEL